MDLCPKVLGTLIEAAIENKYSAASNDQTLNLIRLILREAADKYDENSLRSLGRPVNDFTADVVNQVVAYLIIERAWRHTPLKDNIVERMHAVVYGIPQEEIRFRKTQFVEDFGGIIPTPVCAIQKELREINERMVTEVRPTSSSIHVRAGTLPELHLFQYCGCSPVRRWEWEDSSNGRSTMFTSMATSFHGDSQSA